MFRMFRRDVRSNATEPKEKTSVCEPRRNVTKENVSDEVGFDDG